jgi:flagellar hook-associated protein 1
MSNINNIMDQGKMSLAANQMGLATTSHNISNKDTKGYSRQRVDFESGDPVAKGGHRVGGGVRVGAVRRSHSDFVARRLEQENANFGRYESTSDVLQQLEGIFADDAKQGVTAAVSQFFNNIRTLSSQPESVSLRAAVRESADAVVSRFHNIKGAIGEVVDDVDRRIEGSILDVNTTLDRIASLNNRIMNIEADKKSFANDERDSRDLALQELSRQFNVKVAKIENGGVNVFVDGIGPVVNGTEAVSFEAYRGSDGGNGEGTMRVFVRDPTTSRIVDRTDKIKGGLVGGLIEVRDNSITELKGKIDQLAFGLARSVNQVHSQAFTHDGVSGLNFFEGVDRIDGAADNLRLSSAVQGDLKNIATGFNANSTGDNRALLSIADLQESKILDGNSASFTEFTAGTIGALGVEARTSYQGLDTQQGVMDQLSVLREQASGVSLDEEAMNMLKFQKGFDASAKLIQVADSMMETVLSLKRF